MAFDNLLLERRGAVATLTINRPKVLNALNASTLDEISAACADLRADDSVRAVVITGAGSKAFIAGADISELAEQTPPRMFALAQRGQAAFDQIERLGKPVIAAINGYALGGGCELAMACTLRIAGESAKLGQPEIQLGLMPGYGGSQRLPRLVGTGRALELLLSGAAIDAREAWRIGLVNRVVPDADVVTEAETLAATLATKAPLAVQAILDVVHRGTPLPLAEACALEAASFALLATSDDMREGTRAFLEKRSPAFKGR